jgi:hypothetical protein
VPLQLAAVSVPAVLLQLAAVSVPVLRPEPVPAQTWGPFLARRRW